MSSGLSPPHHLSALFSLAADANSLHIIYEMAAKFLFFQFVNSSIHIAINFREAYDYDWLCGGHMHINVPIINGGWGWVFHSG